MFYISDQSGKWFLKDLFKAEVKDPLPEIPGVWSCATMKLNKESEKKKLAFFEQLLCTRHYDNNLTQSPHQLW